MIEKSPKSETGSAGSERASTDRASSVGERESQTAGRLFEVVIAGVPLRLKSSHDEQTVNELVELVDAKVREALPLTKTGSLQNAAILASLHLAEEYLILKQTARKELERLENKTLKVISELESSRHTGPQNSTQSASNENDSAPEAREKSLDH